MAPSAQTPETKDALFGAWEAASDPSSAHQLMSAWEAQEEEARVKAQAPEEETQALETETES